MLFTFSPEAYDPAQAPTFADPDGDFLSWWGRATSSTGFAWPGRTRRMGALSMPPTRTTCSPGSAAAWDPGGAGRLVVRAGYGMYFDQTQVGMFAQNVQASAFPLIDPFRTDVFVRQRLALESRAQAGTGHCPSRSCHRQPFATSDRFVAPRWQHWNLGLQRRLYSRGMIDLGYVGGRGDHLLRYININQPPADELVAQAARRTWYDPFPGYDAIFMRETTARSRLSRARDQLSSRGWPCGVGDRELHLQSKQGGCDLRQRRDR